MTYQEAAEEAYARIDGFLNDCELEEGFSKPLWHMLCDVHHVLGYLLHPQPAVEIRGSFVLPESSPFTSEFLGHWHPCETVASIDTELAERTGGPPVVRSVPLSNHDRVFIAVTHDHKYAAASTSSTFDALLRLRSVFENEGGA